MNASRDEAGWLAPLGNVDSRTRYRSRSAREEEMLASIIVGLVILIVAGIVIMMKLGGTIQAEVYVAIEKGQYQFIALMEPDGPIIYPKVEGIPDWYLEVTCFAIRQTTPETKAADLAYMKEYNETMYKTLKDSGKFHLIEEDIVKVGKNLGKTP
jgi:hypothetical protein